MKEYVLLIEIFGILIQIIVIYIQMKSHIFVKAIYFIDASSIFLSDSLFCVAVAFGVYYY